MEVKRLYPSSQMVLFLAPNVLKTLMWILGWQGKSIVYYEKQYSKALKMEVDEVERCIQALVDKNIISVSSIDNKWVIEPNGETFQKYYEVPISKVIESDRMLTMADKATWNVVDAPSVVEDMSEQQIQAMILRLQAQLNEKKQVSKLVKNNDVIDDLPW